MKLAVDASNRRRSRRTALARSRVARTLGVAALQCAACVGIVVFVMAPALIGGGFSVPMACMGAVALGVVAAISGVKLHGLSASLVMPLSVTGTFVFIMENANAELSDGLWVIGAFVLFVSSALGLPVIAGLAQSWMTTGREDHSGQ